MKQAMILLLGIIALSSLEARPIEDINLIEGLSYERDEFEHYYDFGTDWFLLSDSCAHIARWRLVPVVSDVTGSWDWVSQNQFHDRAYYALYLDINNLDELNYEKRLIVLMGNTRSIFEDSRYASFAFFCFATGLLRKDTPLFGTGIKTDIEELLSTDNVLYKLENCKGTFSDDCHRSLRLLYKAIVLEKWQSMIPIDTLGVEP